MADALKVIGHVIDLLPNLTYRVQLADGREKICYCAGKMKLAKVKVLIGDKVDVVLDPYDGRATNRIVWRYNQ